MKMRQQAVEALHRLPLGAHEAVPLELRGLFRHRLGRYYAWERQFDHHDVPVLEPGEVTGPPGFVGIGVQKAGTSWWHSLILAHPGVSDRPTIHKERHYFSRFGAESFGETEVDDYRRWFPHRAGTLCGEWTPDYFHYPWVPPLLARSAPDVKLILILRDPLQRFRSGVAHQIRNGGEHIGSIQAEALNMSLYADGLRRWRATFPDEQLLILQFEALVADPTGQLVRTYEYLGLDPEFRPGDLEQSVNQTKESKADLPEDTRHRLEAIVAPDIEALAPMVPNFDFALWASAPGQLG